MRRGGRSSVGRWSPWPGSYAALWRLGVLLGLVGVPTGLQHGVRWFWGCAFAGLVVVLLAALYNCRWQRLQGELFRRTER